jgi:hypothetical protein
MGIGDRRCMHGEEVALGVYMRITECPELILEFPAA